jgi:FkbM family methyltransferase
MPSAPDHTTNTLRVRSTGALVEKIPSKFTGGHWAIRSPTAKNAFQNPMTSCKSVVLNPSDVVVDIGAYVGEYSLYAAKVAKRVIAYEAAPSTYAVLRMNARVNIDAHNLAVVGDDRDEVELFLSTGIGATNSIVKKKSESVTVAAINYDEAVEEATVVKIDVEGAEYDYDIIKENLRAIILEFHPMGDDWCEARKIMSELVEAGFQPTVKIPEFKNGWDTNSAWVRGRSHYG